LLETDELIFRGEARVRIPLASVQSVSAEDGDLVVRYPGGSMRFELGSKAARWAERIKSPRSRLEKLGIKAGETVSVVGVPDPDFRRELAASGARVSWGRVVRNSANIVIGVESEEDLARLPRLKEHLLPAGGIWVVHRKGKGALTDVAIFAAGKRAGLTANKVARFSETHTAERLVIPRALRRG
jgi:hypothetical protein